MKIVISAVASVIHPQGQKGGIIQVVSGLELVKHGVYFNAQLVAIGLIRFIVRNNINGLIAADIGVIALGRFIKTIPVEIYKGSKLCCNSEGNIPVGWPVCYSSWHHIPQVLCIGLVGQYFCLAYLPYGVLVFVAVG